MPFKSGKLAWNEIEWTEDRVLFLKNNYATMTNKQLAVSLGLHLTSVRMKLYSLGLKRLEMEYCTEEQVAFLEATYRMVGDRELTRLFNDLFPKNKGWHHKHIEKKRKYLGLVRTAEEKASIITKQYEVGGRCNTILQNSASANLTDGYIINCIAGKNRQDLKEEIKNHPELIALKRQQLLFNRVIKTQKQ